MRCQVKALLDFWCQEKPTWRLYLACDASSKTIWRFHVMLYKEDLKALPGMRCFMKRTWSLYLAWDANWRLYLTFGAKKSQPEGFYLACDASTKMTWRLYLACDATIKKKTWSLYLECDAVWRPPEAFTWHVMPYEDDLKTLPGMRCHIKRTWRLYLACDVM